MSDFLRRLFDDLHEDHYHEHEYHDDYNYRQYPDRTPRVSSQKIVCNRCGILNEVTNNFCFECGDKLRKESVACPKCNASLSGQAKFCQQCGTQI